MGFSIAISLLTLAIIGSIFLGTFLAWSKHPPTVKFDINVPDGFKLILQHLPANIETDKPVDIAIPLNVLSYIAKESDVYAQETRKRRARAIYADAQDWNIVLRMLEMEDSTLE